MSDRAIVVRAAFQDEVRGELRKLSGDVSAMSQKMNTVGKSARGAGAGMSLLAGAAGGVAAMVAGKVLSSLGGLAAGFVAAASEAETLTLQFKTLLGSQENAVARMQELQKIAAKTPFQLTELANASRVLETLTQGALSTRDGLLLVGDTAAATGSDFQNLAVHVGRAYDGLQNNRPVGESMMRLQELGIVSGEVRGEIERLQEAGRGREAWNVLEQQLAKNGGAMEDLSGTLAGLHSTFRDTMDEIRRRVMQGGALDGLKEGLGSLTETAQDLIDSGVFEDIAKVIGGALGGFAKLAELIKDTVIGWRHLLGLKPEHMDRLDAIQEETKALKEQKRALEAGIEAQERKKERGGDPRSAWGHNPKVAEELNRQLELTESLIEKSEKKLADFYSELYASGGDIVSGFGSGESTGKKSSGGRSGGGRSGGGRSGGGRSGGGVSKAPKLTALDEYNDALYASAQRAFEARVKKEEETQEAISDVQQRYSQLYMSDKERELDDLKTWYDEKLSLVEGNEQAETELKAVYNAQRYEIEQQYREQSSISTQEWADAAVSSAAQVADAITSIQQSRIQKEKQMQIEQVRNSTKTEKEKQKEIENIEREAFERNKRASILQILIDGAVGAVKTIANVGFPAAIPLLVLQGVATVAALATVAAQQFADGGIVDGPSAGDSTWVRANGGEMMLNRRQQTNLFRALDSGRTGGGVNQNIRTGDIIIQGNATPETVAQIRRTQEDQIAEFHDLATRYKRAYGSQAAL